jgi:hypothetical protein
MIETPPSFFAKTVGDDEQQRRALAAIQISCEKETRQRKEKKSTTPILQVFQILISLAFFCVCFFLGCDATDSEKPALTGLVPRSLLVRGLSGWTVIGVGSGRLILLFLCLGLVGRLLWTEQLFHSGQASGPRSLRERGIGDGATGIVNKGAVTRPTRRACSRIGGVYGEKRR